MTTTPTKDKTETLLHCLDLSHFDFRVKEQRAKAEMQRLRDLAMQQAGEGQIGFALASDTEARIAEANAEAYGLAAAAIEVAVRCSAIDFELGDPES